MSPDGGSRLRTMLLLAPLLVFTVALFLLPIALMLGRSVTDPALAEALPRTAAALRLWNGEALPSPALAETFATELRGARGTEALAAAATRLNTDINGFRSLLLRTARLVPPEPPDALAALRAIDPGWGERPLWAAMRRAAGPLTDGYLLAAADLRRLDDGTVGAVPPDRAIFRTVLLRTLLIGAVVTLCCLVLGYPVAYLLASAPPRLGAVLLVLVLVPFWTSLLVRTTAWVVLLQREGLVNRVLRALHVIEAPLQLIYNRVGVYIAITHILLPLMILPLYSVMKAIGPAPMRAALSLGARPLTAFRRVYWPQTRVGVAAGSLLVFISAIGYYVTPELIGGGGDQMVSFFIAFYTNKTMNWGLAAALSTVLLLLTAALLLLYARLQGASRPRTS